MNVSIIGIGKLGLCMALTLERVGCRVVGIDRGLKYIRALNLKKFRSHEPRVNDYLKRSRNFLALTNVEFALKHSDFIFILVATPSLLNGSYDHSQVDRVIDDVMRRPYRNKNFIIGCTVMPGYVDQLQARVKLKGHTVSYNPEFIAQGSIIADQLRPDICLLGTHSEKVKKFIVSLYRKWCGLPIGRFHFMTPQEAEICKVALNCFIISKITMTNMIGDVVSDSGGDPRKVLNAIAADHRIGGDCTKYGYGFGGPCFPRDNRAFSYYATRNTRMATGVLANTLDWANELHAKFMAAKKMEEGRKKYVFTDVGYKPGVVIIEESQKLAVAEIMALCGCKVVIKDRPVIIKQVKEKYGTTFRYEEI